MPSRRKVRHRSQTKDHIVHLLVACWTAITTSPPPASATMTNFSLIFGGVLLLNVLLTFRSSEYYKKWRGTNVEDKASVEDAAQKAEWLKLLRKYLVVYLLATLSDWLQGPYVYALYADYGFSQHDIAVLFVAGFGSSMIFGSFIGGMADWGGRRLFVLIFCAVYASSCVTKRTCWIRRTKADNRNPNGSSFLWCVPSHSLTSSYYLLHRLQQLFHSHARSVAWRGRHLVTLQRL